MSNRNAADGPDPAAAEPPSTDATADASPIATADEPAAGGALVVVCGLPGVGKTTVAKRVAGHVDAQVLRTDVIRKELFPEPSYSEAETEAVYDELLDRARGRVAVGDAVVLDATFADERFRRDVRRMAEETAGRFELVKVECEESVVKRRIERRDGISDADFDVHLRFKKRFDGIDGEHVVVDNSDGEASTFDQVDAVFDRVDAGGD